MVKKEGKYLVNSRIDVDYSKGKPKVKFGYPQKKPKFGDITSIFLNMKIIFVFIIIFLLWELSAYYFGEIYQKEYSYPINCTSQFIPLENYSLLNGSKILLAPRLNVTCDTGNFTIFYDNINSLHDGIGWSSSKEVMKEKINPYTYISEKDSLKIITYGLLLSLFIGFVINVRKGSPYRKKYPEKNAENVHKYYYKFTDKDVENNMIEIPSFKNVILEYNTEGDFDKYLQRVKIKENQYHKIRFKKVNGKQVKKIGKLIKDDHEWYARFYFSQAPKSGWLEVIYH